MEKEQTQTNIPSKTGKEKTSIVTKSITRKISTAQYESVDISVHIQETIHWKNIEERMKKTDAVSTILVIDFMKTLDMVAKELNIDKKVATISKK